MDHLDYPDVKYWFRYEHYATKYFDEYIDNYCFINYQYSNRLATITIKPSPENYVYTKWILYENYVVKLYWLRLYDRKLLKKYEEQNKSPLEFTPVIKFKFKKIDFNTAQTLVDKINNISIPIISNIENPNRPKYMICDGTKIEFKFGNTKFYWNSSPPKMWDKLNDYVYYLINHIDTFVKDEPYQENYPIKNLMVLYCFSDKKIKITYELCKFLKQFKFFKDKNVTFIYEALNDTFYYLLDDIYTIDEYNKYSKEFEEFGLEIFFL